MVLSDLRAHPPPPPSPRGTGVEALKGYRATHTHGTEAITLARSVAHHAGKNARIALAARRSGVWRRLGSRSFRVRWDLVGAAVLSGSVAGVLVVLV